MSFKVESDAEGTKVTLFMGERYHEVADIRASGYPPSEDRETGFVSVDLTVHTQLGGTNCCSQHPVIRRDTVHAYLDLGDARKLYCELRKALGKAKG